MANIELGDRPTMIWNRNRMPAENYLELGEKLAATGGLYASGKRGELLELEVGEEPRTVDNPKELLAVINDRVNACRDDGKPIKTSPLGPMLLSRIFQDCFRVVDVTTETPLYLPDWTVTAPGYNDGGEEGCHVYYLGEPHAVAEELRAIPAFQGVMAWKDEADRTNALALALTVRLRNHWPGGKPIGAIIGNKSHCGKDTVRDYAVGTVGTREISWQKKDWPIEQAYEKATRDPSVGVVSLGNIRSHGQPISSAYIERIVTDPEPLITSTKVRSGRRRPNHIVIAITANEGRLSADLMNRSLPIRLEAVGDVRCRETPIGNPREEFLPRNREQIEAELHLLIRRWRQAGCPLDEEVRHPMSEWAKTIGGILKVNGYDHFLENYDEARTAQDDEREAIAILGIRQPDEWLRPGEWATETENAGLLGRLLPAAHRENHEARRRGIGIVLSRHEDETFEHQAGGALLRLKLEKAQKRLSGGNPHTVYRFEVLERIDPEADEEEEPATTADEGRALDEELAPVPE